MVRRLQAEGNTIIVFDNSSRARVGATEPLGELIQGDIRDERLVHLATKGVDEVHHLAYVNGTKTFYEQPALVLDVGVRGATNVIAACKANRVPHLFIVSSSEVCRAKLVDAEEAIPLVIPDPLNPRYSYSAGKIITEMLAIHNAKSFKRLLICRPFNIYGPGMAEGHVIPDFIDRLKDCGTVFRTLGDGLETRSFCYIDDFIDGYMIMRERGEHMGIYNIGNPVETTISELAYKMAVIAGKQIVLRPGYQLREGDARKRKPDIKKLAALGFKPKIDLDKGLTLTMSAPNVLSDLQ